MSNVICITQASSPKVKTQPPDFDAELTDEALCEVLDDLTLAVIDETTERTGVAPNELLQHIIREWYAIHFDMSASHLRRAIKQSKRNAAAWGKEQA